MKEVFNYIEKLKIASNDNIVIALSGGPDSMALLNILLIIRDKYNFNIICAHVNHNIREESKDEAIFVKDYCENNNVIFETTTFEYESGFSESLGHKMRYDYFDKLIKKYNAKYLFTAHHGDDLVETILMRIVRGSSVNGYIGFEKYIDFGNYKVVRPLVFVTKVDILKYCSDNNIPYVLDKSNEDLKYTRNRYRKNILPVLKEENKNVHLKFLQYSELLDEYIEFVDDLVNDIYNEAVVDNKIKISIIKSKDKVIKRQIIYRWLYSFYKDDINIINKKHIDNIIELIDYKSNISVDLPKYTIAKNYDYIYIKEDNNNIEYNILLDKKVVLPNDDIIEVVDNTDKTNNYVTHLNSKNIKLPLYVRNYKNGDIMTIKNFNGHKKIKDIFINEKVNISDRKNYPVVVDSNNTIIWLPGIKKSSFDSKKDENYDIILEYHSRKELL